MKQASDESLRTSGPGAEIGRTPEDDVSNVGSCRDQRGNPGTLNAERLDEIGKMMDETIAKMRALGHTDYSQEELGADLLRIQLLRLRADLKPPTGPSAAGGTISAEHHPDCPDRVSRSPGDRDTK